MNINEIKKEYKQFLKDTNKKDTKQNRELFKKDFITWYVEMFGLNDTRTKNILEILKEV